MKDAEIHTVRVVDHAAPGQNSLDDQPLLDAIRVALDEHGAIRLSFDGFAPVEDTTPLPVHGLNEDVAPQLLVIDVQRDMNKVIHRCMQMATIRPDAYPLIDLISRDGGPYTLPDDAVNADTLEAMLERMVDQGGRAIDSTESVFERMMRPTMRDLGITVIRCRDDHRMDMADFTMMGPDLAPRGFDYRARNEAPRSYRRR